MYFQFHHRMLQSCIHKGQDEHNWLFFINSITKSDCPVFFWCKCTAVKPTVSTSSIRCCYSDCCKGTSGFTQHCFCNISPNFNTVKKANNILGLLGKFFRFLWTSNMISGTHRGPQTSLWEPLTNCLGRNKPKRKNKKLWDMVTFLQKVYN